MRDVREKVSFFVEIILTGLAFSVYSVGLASDMDKLLSGFIAFINCVLWITICVWMTRILKFSLVKPSDLQIYEHSTERKKSLRDFSDVLVLPLLIIILLWQMLSKTMDTWLIVTVPVLVGFIWLLRLCRFLWYTKAKIKVTLSEQELRVFYPNAIFLSSDTVSYLGAVFPIDEISDVRIVSAEDPEIQRHVILPIGYFLIDRNVKIKRGPYMYALFISDKFPLPDGHQAVALKLKNGRHVLIETDDAENFIAALKKNLVSDQSPVLPDAKIA